MQTFEATLTDSWQEILNGGPSVAFDLIGASNAYVYLSESASNPGSVEGNMIQSFPNDWDFQAVGLEVGDQRVWVKGRGLIRGVR